MPTLKKINREAGTNFRRTTELVAALAPPAPPERETFTVEYRDGALVVDGPMDPAKWYRLMILSPNGNPIQDIVKPIDGGPPPWPYVWSAETHPGWPPPAPPLQWTLQEENYLSRRWRNRRQYPGDYVSTVYEGEIGGSAP